MRKQIKGREEACLTMPNTYRVLDRSKSILVLVEECSVPAVLGFILLYNLRYFDGEPRVQKQKHGIKAVYSALSSESAFPEEGGCFAVLCALSNLRRKKKTRTLMNSLILLPCCFISNI